MEKLKDPLFAAIGIFVRHFTEESFQLWMQVRSEQGAFKGLWEFPGGKIEPGETPDSAARREIEEEVGIPFEQTSVIKPFKVYSHQYPQRLIHIHSYLLPEVSHLSEKGQWIELKFSRKQLPVEVKTLEANHQMITDLCTYLSVPENRKYLWV